MHLLPAGLEAESSRCWRLGQGCGREQLWPLGTAFLSAQGRPWGLPNWAFCSDTRLHFTGALHSPPGPGSGLAAPAAGPGCGDLGLLLWVWGQQPHVTAVWWQRSLSPMWGLSSCFTPTAPAEPLCPWVRREGRALSLCPQLLFGKKLKLKENLQGIPSGHHLLFTLKFQNMQNIGKLLTSASFSHPTPLPMRLRRLGLSRQDSLPLGSFLVPRSEPPPHTWTVSRPPLHPQAAPRLRLPVVALALLFWTEVLPGPHTQSPPSRDAEDTSALGASIQSPAGQTALGAGPTASDRSPPQSTAGGARGPVCPMLRARTPAERPAGDSGRPSAARVGAFALGCVSSRWAGGVARGSALWLLFRASCHELPFCPRLVGSVGGGWSVLRGCGTRSIRLPPRVLS